MVAEVRADEIRSDFAADSEQLNTLAICAYSISSYLCIHGAMHHTIPAPQVSADFDLRLQRRIRNADSSSWIERMMQPFRGVFARPALALAALCLVMAAGLLLQNPRTGVAPAANSHSRVEKIEPEQVERALDDMQMLRELSSAPITEGASSKTL
jgi:hypothetical protein